MKKVKVDTEGCIGCGLCIGSCPEVFAFDDNGQSTVVAEAEDEAAVDEVIASCPVSVIEWDA